MIEITYAQMVAFISIVWIIVRLIVAVINREFSIKRELKMLLVYVCLIVIARFVYFGFLRVNGRIDTLKIDMSRNSIDMINIIPFFFVVDRYDGWLINVLGNILMFVPVGIVWPICFKRLNTFKKTMYAGLGLTLFIELSQLLCYERHTDIDDLMLNTFGIAIGALIVFSRNKQPKNPYEVR